MAETAGNGGGQGPSSGTASSPGIQAGDLKGQPANDNTEKAANEQVEQKEPYRFRAKLKVDGKEEDVDLSEDEIGERLQRQRAYERKEKQYRDGFAEIERVKTALSHLHTNPLEVMQSLGVDVATLWQTISQQQQQLQALTPEQRQILERDQLIAQLRAEAEENKTRQQSQEAEAFKQAVWNESQPRIVAAMEAAGLPRTTEAIRMYAIVGQEWLDKGYDAPESVIAQETAARLRANSQAFSRSMSPEQLEAMLGDEAINALLKRRLEKAQAARAKKQHLAKPTTNGTHAKEEPAYIDEAEFRRRAGL